MGLRVPMGLGQVTRLWFSWVTRHLEDLDPQHGGPLAASCLPMHHWSVSVHI